MLGMPTERVAVMLRTSSPDNPAKELIMKRRMLVLFALVSVGELPWSPQDYCYKYPQHLPIGKVPGIS